jgi:hypothetical protein
MQGFSEYYIAFVALLVLCVVIPAGGFFAANRRGRNLFQTRKFEWKPELFVVLTLIGVLTGIRGVEFGMDYPSYHYFYEYILQYGGWPDRLIGNEIGWQYMNLMAGKVGLPSSWFFGCVTSTTMLLFMRGSHRAQYLLPSMLFFLIATGFFYSHTWSALRQALSVSIFFVAAIYIIERRLIRFVAALAVASLFHLSSLAMLPLFFISRVPYDKWIALVLYGVSLAVLGALNFAAVRDIIASSIDAIPGLQAYNHILTMDQFQEAREVSGTNLGFAWKSIFTVWIIWQSDKIIKEIPYFKIYIIMYVAFAILSNVFFSVELIGRLLAYFYICFPIVAAATIRVSSGQLERTISVIFLIGFLVLFLVTTQKFVDASLSRG